MASIRQRGNSYQVTVSNGRRADGSKIIETDTFTPEPGMTKKQIEKALNEFVVDFERDVKAGVNTKGERMTLQQLSLQFLEDMKPIGDPEVDVLALPTYNCYRHTLEQRIIHHLGHYKIGFITLKLLRDYSKKLREDGARSDGRPGGLSEATIKKDCAIVSALLSYAVGEGLLRINPLIYSGTQKRHKKPAAEYKVKYFTIEQTKTFLWVLDHPIPVKHEAHTCKKKNGSTYQVQEYTIDWQLSIMWRAYFYLALFVGDRRGENIALTWDDINFKTGTVNIDKATAYTDGLIYQKETKTKKSRTPVIPPVVIEILKKWKAEQRMICLRIGSQWVGYRGEEYDKNFVFIQWNGKQVHPSTPYHQFKRIIQIYNKNMAKDEVQRLPDDATPHGLRHTAASILIANNMDPRSVAGVIGHADPSTTLNIYSYFFRTKNQEAADIMSQVLAGTGEPLSS